MRRDSRKHYEELLALQGGTCAICPRVPEGRRLCLDHDHRTMEPRGLLCTACNLRLSGRVTVPWMRNAIAYIEDPPYRRLK